MFRNDLHRRRRPRLAPASIFSQLVQHPSHPMLADETFDDALLQLGWLLGTADECAIEASFLAALAHFSPLVRAASDTESRADVRGRTHW